MILQGKVVSTIVAKGSKSERSACVLVVGKQKYILRKKGMPPFGDTTFESCINKTVEVDGTSLGTTFLVDKFKIIE